MRDDNSDTKKILLARVVVNCLYNLSLSDEASIIQQSISLPIGT